MLSTTATTTIEARSAGAFSRSAAIEDLIEKGLRWEREQKGREAGEYRELDKQSILKLGQLAAQLSVVIENQTAAATISEIRTKAQTEATGALIEKMTLLNKNMGAVYDRVDVVLKFVGTILPRALNRVLLMLSFNWFRDKKRFEEKFTKEQEADTKKLAQDSYKHYVCERLDEKEEAEENAQEQKTENKGVKKS